MCIARRSQDLLVLIFVPLRQASRSDFFAFSILLLQHRLTICRFFWFKFLRHLILFVQGRKYPFKLSNVLCFRSFIFTKLGLLDLLVVIVLAILAIVLLLPDLVIIAQLLDVWSLAFEKASCLTVLSRYQLG